MLETSTNIYNTLQNINSFHNDTKNIINILQQFKLEIGKYYDRLHRYQLEVERYIANDKLIKQILHAILNILNELLKRAREEERAVQEKKAAIAAIKDETRTLERELASIEKEIVEGQKEIEILEEFLNYLLMIGHLREEVKKLKNYSKELEGIDDNVCFEIHLN